MNGSALITPLNLFGQQAALLPGQAESTQGALFADSLEATLAASMLPAAVPVQPQPTKPALLGHASLVPGAQPAAVPTATDPGSHLGAARLNSQLALIPGRVAPLSPGTVLPGAVQATASGDVQGAAPQSIHAHLQAAPGDGPLGLAGSASGLARSGEHPLLATTSERPTLPVNAVRDVALLRPTEGTNVHGAAVRAVATARAASLLAGHHRVQGEISASATAGNVAAASGSTVLSSTQGADGHDVASIAARATDGNGLPEGRAAGNAEGQLAHASSTLATAPAGSEPGRLTASTAEVERQLAQASSALARWQDASTPETESSDLTPATIETRLHPSPSGDRPSASPPSPADDGAKPPAATTATVGAHAPTTATDGAVDQRGDITAGDRAIAGATFDAPFESDPLERGLELGQARFRTATNHPAAGAQIAVQIMRSLPQGIDRFSLQLQPVELGSVDIQLDFERNGRVNALITAERPETLDLLQRDSRLLERSLGEAGVKLSGDGLSFALKQEHQHQQQGQGFHDQAGRQQATSLAGRVYQDGASDAETPSQTVSVDASRLLDIRT